MISGIVAYSQRGMVLLVRSAQPFRGFVRFLTYP